MNGEHPACIVQQCPVAIGRCRRPPVVLSVLQEFLVSGATPLSYSYVADEEARPWS